MLLKKLFIFMLFPLTLFASNVSEVTPTQLRQKVSKKENLIILDVRTSSEYKSGHIKNSLHIPFDEISKRQKELDKNTEIIVYCKSGTRAKKALNTLTELGFKRLSHLKGDWLGWKNSKKINK